MWSHYFYTQYWIYLYLLVFNSVDNLDNSSCDIFKLKDINLIENTTNKQELDENEILTTNGKI